MIHPRTCRRARALAVLSLSLLLFAACGGSDPGRGTRTLFVEAQAHTEGTRESTWIFVVVREGDRNGRQLADEVTVRVRGHDEGEWDLPFGGIEWGGFVAGSHQRSGLEWKRGYHLEVERNDESWLDAYLEFPGLTRITEPVSGTAYRPDRGVPLTVQWEDDAGRRAQEVRVELNRNDYSRDIEGDARSHDIPATTFTRTGNERVTVYRANEVELAGGTGGSYFQAVTRHRIEFVVE